RKWSEKTETTLDDFIIQGIEKTILPVLYLIVFYLALKSLVLPEVVNDIFDKDFIILVTFLFIRVITSTIKFTLSSYIKRRSAEEDAERRLKQIKGIMIIISFIIWSLGFVFLLD